MKPAECGTCHELVGYFPDYCHCAIFCSKECATSNPRGKANLAERNRDIAALRAKGWSLARIGEAHGITKQAVSLILRKPDTRDTLDGGTTAV